MQAKRSKRPKPPVRYGKNNNRYNGGLSTTKDGRTIIVCRDGTLMLYSRAVMAAHVGRLLDPNELVHHVNENPSDDRVENLQIVTRAEHLEIHRHQHVRTFKRGNEHHRTKISDADAANARRLFELGESANALGRRYGVSGTHMRRILRGESR